MIFQETKWNWNNKASETDANIHEIWHGNGEKALGVWSNCKCCCSDVSKLSFYFSLKKGGENYGII